MLGDANHAGPVRLSDTYDKAVGGAQTGIAASQKALYNAYNSLNSRILKCIKTDKPLLRQVEDKYSGPGGYPNQCNFTVTVKDNGIYLFIAPQLGEWNSSQILLTITSWQCTVDFVLKNAHNWTFTGSNPSSQGQPNRVTIKGGAYPSDVYLVRLF